MLIRIMLSLLMLNVLWAHTLVETGFLRNNVGRPYTGIVSLEFKLYTSSTDTTTVWDSGPMTISVNEGLYTAFLGSDQNPLDETVINSTKDYYLGYTINGDNFPNRTCLAYNARSIFANFALHAQQADLATTANKLVSMNISQFSNDSGYLTSTNISSLMIFTATSNYAYNSALLGGLSINQLVVPTASTALTANKLASMQLSQFNNDSSFVSSNYSGNVVVNGTYTLNGSALFNGSIRKQIGMKTTDYSLGASDNVVLVSANAADITVTLPLASSCSGRVYTIKKVDSGMRKVVISCTGSDTIEDRTAYTLFTRWQYVALISNGIAWFVSEGN